MQNQLRSIETELDYQNALEVIEKLFDVEATSSLSNRFSNRLTNFRQSQLLFKLLLFLPKNLIVFSVRANPKPNYFIFIVF